MSVVNQMLLELDRRRASATERAALPGIVRALPPEGRPAIPWRPVVFAALLLCGGSAAAWFIHGRLTPMTAAVASPAEVGMRPPAADAARDMQAARSPGGEAGAADSEPQLKWADLLVSVPRGAPTPQTSRPSFQPKPAAQAADVAQGGDPEAARLAALPARASEPPPPEAAPPATEAPGQAGAVIIDKQPAEGTPAIRAVARDADAIASALRDARAQAQHGELAAAAQTLQRHAAAGASHAEYRGLHAAVLQRLSVHAEAVEEYRAALRLAPNTSVWWLGLGISLEALGRTPQAREAFERARGGNLSAELAVFADQKLQTLR